MRRMDVIEAIRTRRTVKAFRPDPVPREQLERILGAARWAPNHRLTQPWRFRHVGPVALGRLMSASGDEKLLRAPTLVVASYAPSPLPPHAVEDKGWAEQRLGPDRIEGAYAWRTLRRQRAHQSLPFRLGDINGERALITISAEKVSAFFARIRRGLR